MSDTEVLILYEDSRFLVLNKPYLMPSTPGKSSELSAVEWVATHRPEIAKVFLDRSEENGLLHRLDNTTSGCLAFAKTEQVYQEIRAIWGSSTTPIEKIYKARVSLPENGEGPRPQVIDLSIAHDSKSTKKMRVVTPQTRKTYYRGKPQQAVTEIIEVQNRVDLTLKITTGVRHQIRVHLSALGWPILGDTLYRGAPSERVHLHAWKLSLPGVDQSIEAAIPWGNGSQVK